MHRRAHGKYRKLRLAALARKVRRCANQIELTLRREPTEACLLFFSALLLVLFLLGVPHQLGYALATAKEDEKAGLPFHTAVVFDCAVLLHLALHDHALSHCFHVLLRRALVLHLLGHLFGRGHHLLPDVVRVPLLSEVLGAFAVLFLRQNQPCAQLRRCVFNIAVRTPFRQIAQVVRLEELRAFIGGFVHLHSSSTNSQIHVLPQPVLATGRSSLVRGLAYGGQASDADILQPKRRIRR